MTITAKQLREQRHKLVQQARTEILEKAEAENRDMTAQEKESWAKIMGGTAPDGSTIRGEVDVLKERIDRIEALDRIDTEMSQRAGDGLIGRGPLVKPDAGGDGAALAASDEQRALALQAWLRANNDHALSDSHLAACRAVGLNPHASRLHLATFGHETNERLRQSFAGVRRERQMEHGRRFLATLGTTPGASGGYLIPPETLTRELEINMLWYGGMRQVAETITTSSGERMSWPTADDTTNTGTQLGESASIGSSVDPSFAKVFWDAYKFSSKPILIPYELLQDAAFNLPAIIGEMLGIRLGRITNTKYTTGTGAATPKGIVTAASSFSAASATAIAADDLFGLYHSIDPAYRNACGWMMHDTILLTLRKLKDGMGRYLWQDGLQSNAPDTLLGDGITINQDMDSTISSGKKTILFGQLGKYKIRRVGGVRLYRLEERYRDTDQDAFIALIREDGNLLTAGTAPVKYLAH